jgi:ribonuclease HI/ADP-ribose pyrophosphatase YjhB (NUDIX family)
VKQRVVVQAVIEHEGKVLLFRRSHGRPGIVGKYELPGGTIDDDEQPDDALRRHLRNDVGLEPTSLTLRDVISMHNREEGDVQHVLVSYVAGGVDDATAIRLGPNYDEFEWISKTEIQQNHLRDSALTLLGLYTAEAAMDVHGKNDNYNDVLDTTKHKGAIIYSDGGSRGNPGPSAAAFVILDEHKNVIDTGGEYIGITTNNQAEYQGVRLGLERASELGLRSIEFRIDSMLVVNQLRGVYKIKNRELWPINERIVALCARFEKVRFTHVPRELNQQADSLVNVLLDQHKADIA